MSALEISEQRNINCRSITSILNSTTCLECGPNLFEWICLSFVVVTIPVHIVTLIVVCAEILINRRDNNSFYLICLAAGVLDLICLWNNYAFYLFPRWRWLNLSFIGNGDVALHVGFFISWGLGIGQVNLTFLMTTNRYTAILHPTKHDNFWEWKKACGMIFSIQLVGIAFGGIVFWSEVCATVTKNGEIVIKLLSVKILGVTFGLAGLSILFDMILIIWMYAKIFKFLVTRRQSIQDRKQSVISQNFTWNSNRQEQKLLAMSVSVCVAFLAVFVCLAIKAFLGLDRENVIYVQLNTICCTVNIYSLLIFSGVIRKRLLSMFGCLRARQNTRHEVAFRIILARLFF
ncbi:hypothetical protein M3Y97_01087500 [Aphelenchoides bicaudatus]|nr:hypothetical protein M3Y97_01087500 [Aphelenchoides bicaudatus]